ncbi:hypothetical protein [Delftia tsuruhatensis]|uniref:hypothetical protein n=1 Tax=Delftia tsuruhatensis TaxID=180282 RepID=UPI002AD1ECD6|nr:hypothetical protein [Delftia tsuruhatensis]WQM80352.1 hypothetical protein RNT40_16655 [Delftia tsuruhatensis]
MSMTTTAQADPFPSQPPLAGYAPEVLAAGCLLVIGRRALHEYGANRGENMAPLIALLQQAVGAWTAAGDCDRSAVLEVAAAVDAHLLPDDFPATH